MDISQVSSAPSMTGNDPQAQRLLSAAGMVRWVNALTPASARALRNIYAQIPDLHCKGLCANSCRTRIDMSTAELERIEGVSGRRLPESMFQREGLVCPLLEDDRCTVYGVRPTVCRLWGVAESMPCRHGCTPDGGRLLTDDEAMELQLQTLEVGGARHGGDTARARLLLQQVPELKPLMARVMRGDRAARDEMAALVRKRFPDGFTTEPPPL
jgi:Fe-S-cluster containining protein